MASQKNKKKNRRRASRTTVYFSAAGALIALLGGILCWPGAASVLLLGACALLATPLLLKRRSKRAVYALIACGCVLIAAGFALRFARVNVGWSSYSRNARTVDLSGKGLKNLDTLAQFPLLDQADVRDNPGLEVGSYALQTLERLDVRGCGLTREAYETLSARMPECLILCEQATALSAGGLTADELSEALSALPGVREVDLTGANLTGEEEATLRERFPSVRLYSKIDAGGEAHDSAEKQVVLQVSGYDEALDLLAQFESPESVELNGTSFTAEQALALKARLGEARLTCALLLDGQQVRTDAQAITWAESAQELAQAAPLLGSLQSVELTGERTLEEIETLRESFPDAALSFTYRSVRIIPGETTQADALSSDEIARLQALCPEARLEWTVEVLGKRVGSLDKTLDFGNQQVSDDQVDALCQALDRLPGLEQVLLYESRLSFESMDRLFDGYPEVFFGFTTRMDKYKVRSDVTAFSTLKNQRNPYYTQDDMYFLRYCRNLQALDLGHNKITDISFLSWFPHLKVLILADNRITDISVLSQLTELEYIELFMNEIADFSPLASLGNLIDLNICYNLSKERRTIEDVTPIYQCTKLERCWISNNGLTEQQQADLRAALPACEFNFTVEQSTDGGWRKHARYYVVRDMMKSRVYTPFE